MSVASWLLLALALAPVAPLVDVQRALPEVVVDLRYATPDNFTKQRVYPENARCLLRAPVVERLRAVAKALHPRGLRLLLWDCYRPRSVQQRFWQLVPDARYVADPKKGSRHNRGAAVDLSLVDDAGHPLDLGSTFDDFSARAHRDFSGISKRAAENRKTLEDAMRAAGFIPLPTEWWHFDASGWEDLPAADEPL